MTSKALKFLKNLFMTSLMRGVGLFYALLLCLKMMFDTLRFGTKVWVKKQRRKNSVPSRYISWTPPGGTPASTITWKHCYVMANGIRFHYVTTGPMPANLKVNVSDRETKLLEKTEDEDDKPKLLLCLHGFPESWYSWRYVLKSFEDEPSVTARDGGKTSYFVVALDMRGCGNSDKPSGIAAYHQNHLSADVRAVVFALGYEKCTLLGNDWGGMVAWKVVETYPEIIERLIVLNCPHPDAGIAFAIKNPKQLLIGSWYMYVFMVPVFAEIYISFKDYEFIDNIMGNKDAGIRSPKHKLDQEDYEVIKYSFEGRATGAGINYYRALLLPFYQPPEGYNNKHKSSELSIPIFVLWGENDAFLDKKMAVMTKSYLPVTEPPSRVVMTTNMSHWIQQDKPEFANSKIREFLAE